MSAKYTYQTFQQGVMGAVAVIRRNGVQIAETPLCQAFGEGDTDRCKAARVAVERIADLKVIEGESHVS